MATFDQLPAEQRAILELVLQRGQSYTDLADMLGMSTSRVRQLAREALTDLSPRSAGRVDADWRGQVADYLLGQQTGPEVTATRGHLRRSEAARLWALSLLDSLDHLYAGGEVPDIPEGDGGTPERGRERAPRRERRPRRERAPRREPEPASEAEAEPEPRRERKPRRSGSPLAGVRKRVERPARPLSSDAEAIVRRRRIAGAAGLATLLLFILLVWPVGLLTGDDDDGGGGDGGSEQSEEQAPVQQLLLRPQQGEKGIAIAFITERDGEPFLVLRGQELRRTRQGEAYEVWLYNSRSDAVSLGAQLTDRRGNYDGATRIPADFSKYEFIDISRENVDQDEAHSGDSVLRGRLDDLQESALGQQQPGAEGEAPPGGAPQGGAPQDDSGGGFPLPGE